MLLEKSKKQQPQFSKQYQQGIKFQTKKPNKSNVIAGNSKQIIKRPLKITKVILLMIETVRACDLRMCCDVIQTLL